LPNFFKNSPNGLQVKKGQNIYNLKTQNIYIKKLLNTYNKPCFETAYLGENGINLLQQKLAQKVTISLGYFMFLKNSQNATKSHPIGEKLPCLVTLLRSSVC
jgi:hypothetical protein